MVELWPDAEQGPHLRVGGLELYPPGDCVAKARALFAAIPPEEHTLFLILRPALAHGLREWVANLPASSTVLPVDSRADTANLYSERAPGNDARLQPLQPTGRVADYAAAHDYFGCRRVKTVLPTRVAVEERRRFAGITEQIARNIEQFWQNRLTTMYHGRRWLTNLIANFPYLAKTRCTPLDRLAGSLPAAVIIGAGPSLDTVIEQIQERRHLLCLIAVDTAWPALRDAGIVPNVICSVDAQVHSVRDFLPLPQCPVIADLLVPPAIFRPLATAIHACMSKAGAFAIFDRFAAAGLPVTVVPPLGSVGVLAMYLALQAGFKLVGLVGLDFAFTHGKTHARSTPAARTTDATHARLTGDIGFADSLRYPTVSVGTPADPTLITTRALAGYRDILDSVIAGATPNSGRTVDAAVCDLRSTGIPIERAVRCSFADFSRRAAAMLATATRADQSAAGGDGIPPTQPTVDCFAQQSLINRTIQHEIALLEHAVTAVHRVLNAESPWTDGVSSAVRAVDYVTIGFPDPMVRHDHSYLKRFLVAGYDAMQRWRIAQTTAGTFNLRRS